MFLHKILILTHWYIIRKCFVKMILHWQTSSTYVVYSYRVSQKKMGLVFRGYFRPLNGRKSKKVRKQPPPKIQFNLLRGVFSPVYNTYTPCIHHVYHASEWCLLGNCMESNIKQVHNQVLQSTNWPLLVGKIEF